MANSYENYTFFSCPKAQVSSTRIIDCLSNSSMAIVATKHQASMCKKILTVPFRLVFLFCLNMKSLSPLISHGSAPRFAVPGTGAGEAIDPPIVLLIPAIAIATLIFVSCCIMARRDNHDSNYSSTQTNQGLDEPAVETYEKMTIRESRCIPGSNDITRAICLEDVSNDTLRFMPECEHCFLVECIDKWLRMNSKCPICRIN